jgi:hypothetical protein
MSRSNGSAHDRVRVSRVFVLCVCTGYTRTQTIERLVEKAGCDEPLTKKLVAKIKCIRFQVRSPDPRAGELDRLFARCCCCCC